jgi:hypothetical protein
MAALLKDHGLPLIQLKERRRDLIVALIGRHGLVSEQQISEIAAVQSAPLKPFSRIWTLTPKWHYSPHSDPIP